MSFDWKALAKGVAPMLGTALGGPLGGVAAAALAKALGVSGDEKSLEKAILHASPEQIVALQKADQEFKVSMTRLGFENEQALEKLALDDRMSARNREMALKDRMPALLASGITLGFFGILAWMLARPIPSESRDVLNIMLGSLGTAWVSVVSYYFGSSSGSARKTELLKGK